MTKQGDTLKYGRGYLQQLIKDYLKDKIMKTILKLQDRKVQVTLFCVAMAIGTCVVLYMAHIGVIHIDKY